MLLTGDRRLRALSKARGTEVHGALWAVDQIHEIVGLSGNHDRSSIALIPPTDREALPG